jgi:hypothetical protein
MSLLLLLQREYVDSLLSDTTEESTGTAQGQTTGARNEWTFILADSNGAAADVLDPAIVRAELTMRRSEISTLELELSGEDDRAYTIIQKLTQTRPLVYAYRDQVLYFAGFLTALREQGEEDVTMQVTFSDALATLQHRLTNSDIEYYDQDAATLIAGTFSSGKSLLEQANTLAATGLVAGTVSSSVGVETFNTSRDVVYDKIRELASIVGGPDLRVSPQSGSSTFGILDVGALYVGGSSVANFGYGGGTVANLTGFSWEIQPPLTRVVCIGSDVEGSSDVTGDVTTAEGRIGVWQSQIQNNDLYLETDCVNAANGAVRLDWTVTVSISPTPAATPRPLRDYKIGDLVSVRANRGSLKYGGILRVREISISIDDQGIETDHRIETEAGGTPSGLRVDETGLVAITADAFSDSGTLANSFA